MLSAISERPISLCSNLGIHGIDRAGKGVSSIKQKVPVDTGQLAGSGDYNIRHIRDAISPLPGAAMEMEGILFFF